MTTPDNFNLPVEVHNFIAIKIREGLSPSNALRAMHSQFGEQNVVHMAYSLSTIYGVRTNQILQYLGHWWFDSTSYLTDGELDQHIFKAISECRTENDA